MTAGELSEKLGVSNKDIFGAVSAHIRVKRHFARDSKGLLGLIEEK